MTNETVEQRRQQIASTLRPRRCGGKGCHRLLGELALPEQRTRGDARPTEIFLYCHDCKRWQPRPPSAWQESALATVRCHDCTGLLGLVQLPQDGELFLRCRRCHATTYLRGPV